MSWERYQQGCPTCGLTVHETSWRKYGCEDCDQCIDEQEEETGADYGDQIRLRDKESDL